MTIEDWPNLFELDFEQSNASVGEHADSNQDPAVVEWVEPRWFNSIDEPGLADNELLVFHWEHFGDMAEDKWIDLCKFHSF